MVKYEKTDRAENTESVAETSLLANRK